MEGRAREIFWFLFSWLAVFVTLIFAWSKESAVVYLLVILIGLFHIGGLVLCSGALYFIEENVPAWMLILAGSFASILFAIAICAMGPVAWEILHSSTPKKKGGLVETKVTKMGSLRVFALTMGILGFLEVTLGLNSFLRMLRGLGL
jgi:hypothetical protein